MRPICGIFSDRDRDIQAELAAMAAALAAVGYPAMTAQIHGRFSSAQCDPKTPSNQSQTGISNPLPLAADCRIDAREALLADLAQSDLRLTSSDDQLIAAAHRKWGDKCPRHLIGDYAFAIFDPAAGALFCARDHVGARPFFYTFGPGGFAFSSDLNALLALPWVDPALDEPFIATTLHNRRYRPFDRTFFRDIRKLPPGHCLSVRDGSVRVSRYWSPANAAPVRLPTDRAYADRLRELHEFAVADRLRDGSRFGIHISGGLDSTAVAATAVPLIRASGRPEPIGFSWHRLDPGAAHESEPAWSEAVRAAIGIELIAPAPEADTIAGLLRRDVARHPNPGNLINESAVQIAAEARGIDTILSGWGGDQAASFSGRGYRNELFARGKWRRLWRESGVDGFRRRMKRFAGTGLSWLREATRRTEPVARSLANPAFLRRVRLLRVPIVRATNTKQVMRDLYANGAMTARLEDWALSGARRGIDYRYPLLDRRILDFCYGLPSHLFAKNGATRWLMREAMADLLPPVVAAHAGKAEPVRTETTAPPLLAAFQILADELEARIHPPRRAEYIDMEALMARLRQGWDSPNGQAPVRLALQMLDFGNGQQ